MRIVELRRDPRKPHAAEGKPSDICSSRLPGPIAPSIFGSTGRLASAFRLYARRFAGGSCAGYIADNMGQGRTTEMIDCKLSFVFALLILHAGAVAAETNLVAPTTVGPVAVRVYPAPGEKPRPTVLILHGRSGLVSGDEQYASEIAKAGMDAWLFSYYSATDDEVMRNADHSRRVEYFNDRFLDWAKAISDIAGFAFAQKNSSGRLGLLGLSNGGFLAVGAAAIDQRIGAIVVSYGGIANPTKNKISRLPPLLRFTEMPTVLFRLPKAKHWSIGRKHSAEKPSNLSTPELVTVLISQTTTRDRTPSISSAAN